MAGQSPIGGSEKSHSLPCFSLSAIKKAGCDSGEELMERICRKVEMGPINDVLGVKRKSTEEGCYAH